MIAPSMHERGRARPACVLFDVVGTLFSLDRPRRQLSHLGLAHEALDVWFNCLLRDALALDAAGTFLPFQEVARDSLQVLAAEHGWKLSDKDMKSLVESLGQLEAYADVEPAFRLLSDAGIEIAALTNGARASTAKLLDSAGLLGYVRHVLTIDDVRRWKPRREVYDYALRAVGRAAEDVALVAAHAWDVHGAHQAGLTTAWVARLEMHFHGGMAAPDVKGTALVDVASRLLGLPPPAELGATT